MELCVFVPFVFYHQITSECDPCFQEMSRKVVHLRENMTTLTRMTTITGINEEVFCSQALASN